MNVKAWVLLLVVSASSVARSFGQATNELDLLKSQLRQLQENFDKAEQEHRQQLESLSKKLEALEKTQAGNTNLSAAVSSKPASPGLDAGTNAAPGSGLLSGRLTSPRGNAYLDIGLIGTVALGTSTASDIEGGTQLGGHDPNQRGFTLQGIEASFSGAVDPYFRGSASLLFSVDSAGDSYLEVEEAWLETVSLPGNLQLRAGQILTEFGRQNPTHPHTWAFVDTPLVLGRLFGPDGLRNPGARLSWLMPTPVFSELTLSLQNSQGETAYSFRNGSAHSHGTTADEDLPFSYRHADNDRGVTHFQDLLITPRYALSFDLTDSQTLMLGTSAALGPNSRGGEGSGDTWTQIYGLDLTWKWKSPSHHSGFPFVTFQTEALLRRAEVGLFDWDENGNGSADTDEIVDETTGLPAVLQGEDLLDYGFYSQVLYGFKKGWVAGLRVDYVSSEEGDYEKELLTLNGAPLGRDPQRAQRWRLSPNLTWYPSEYSKIRLQYNLDDRAGIGVDHSIWLQFEFVLGAHTAHRF